jgi:hypothetical protein
MYYIVYSNFSLENIGYKMKQGVLISLDILHVIKGNSYGSFDYFKRTIQAQCRLNNTVAILVLLTYFVVHNIFLF